MDSGTRGGSMRIKFKFVLKFSDSRAEQKAMFLSGTGIHFYSEIPENFRTKRLF